MNKSDLQKKIQSITNRVRVRALRGADIHGYHIDEVQREVEKLVNQYAAERTANYQEELKDFAQDVLGQFGYSGSSGGLSTLEWAESIIEKGGKL